MKEELFVLVSIADVGPFSDAPIGMTRESDIYSFYGFSFIPIFSLLSDILYHNIHRAFSGSRRAMARHKRMTTRGLA